MVSRYEEDGKLRHAGDFCEIPGHDKLSYKIAHEIYRNLKNLREFTTQNEIETPDPVTVLAEE